MAASDVKDLNGKIFEATKKPFISHAVDSTADVLAVDLVSSSLFCSH